MQQKLQTTTAHCDATTSQVYVVQLDFQHVFQMQKTSYPNPQRTHFSINTHVRDDTHVMTIFEITSASDKHTYMLASCFAHQTLTCTMKIWCMMIERHTAESTCRQSGTTITDLLLC